MFKKTFFFYIVICTRMRGVTYTYLRNRWYNLPTKQRLPCKKYHIDPREKQICFRCKTTKEKGWILLPNGIKSWTNSIRDDRTSISVPLRRNVLFLRREKYILRRLPNRHKLHLPFNDALYKIDNVIFIKRTRRCSQYRFHHRGPLIVTTTLRRHFWYWSFVKFSSFSFSSCLKVCSL